MLLFRCGRKDRWARPEEAQNDLRPRERPDLESGYECLSVYSAENRADAERVAAVYAITHLEPNTVGVILLDRQKVKDFGLDPIHIPSDTIPEYLSKRHIEIAGLEDDEMRLGLATWLLDSTTAFNLRKTAIAELCINHGIRDEAGVAPAVKPSWTDYVTKFQARQQAEQEKKQQKQQQKKKP